MREKAQLTGIETKSLGCALLSIIFPQQELFLSLPILRSDVRIRLHDDRNLRPHGHDAHDDCIRCPDHNSTFPR